MDFNRNFPWQRVNFCLLFCLSVHDNEFSKFERMMLQHTDPMFSQGFKNEILRSAGQFHYVLRLISVQLVTRLANWN